MESTAPAEMKKSLKDGAIEGVTVFADRAEVVRSFDVAFDAPGRTIIRVEGLSEAVVPESIRCKGAGAYALESVSYAMRRLMPDEVAGEETEIDARIEELVERCVAIDDEIEAVGEQKRLLNAFAESLTACIPGSGGSGGAAPPIGTDVDGAFAMLQDHQEKTGTLNGALRGLRKEKALRTKEIESLRKQHAIIVARKRERLHSRDVTVAVSAEGAGEAILVLTYVVSNCAWGALYDIRYDAAQQTSQVCYYANITNNTMEDWADVQLVLSTAKPSLGGSPPELPLKVVHWPAPTLAFGSAAFSGAPLRSGRSMKLKRGGRRAKKMAAPGAPAAFGAASEDDEEEDALMEAAVVQSTVEKSATGNAAFAIDTLSTVRCDGKPQRVTIATLDLSTSITHYAVPELSPHAFVQAHISNTSDFLLLKSLAVSVFVDGSFVTSTKLAKDVPSGGAFPPFFLGPDGDVTVDCKPPVQEHSRQGGGFFGGKERLTQLHRCVTEVVNNKAEPITLRVDTALPRSGDEAISVDPVEPTAERIDGAKAAFAAAKGAGAGSKLDHGLYLDPQNTLTSVFPMRPQERREVRVVYAISYPKDDPRGVPIV